MFVLLAVLQKIFPFNIERLDSCQSVIKALLEPLDARPVFALEILVL
jgi:hypothetical protein